MRDSGPSPEGMGLITEVTPPSLLVLRMYPYPDTSMTNHQHLTINTQHPTIAGTLCVIG